uniref:BTB domain-containing protein n=1 Tax=Globodera pallida TaxID=36090 RepID=A0A183CKT3_GLOPA
MSACTLSWPTDNADVHFLVGKDDEKELLPAHKAILEKASDVFERMFRFDEANAKAAAAAGTGFSEEIKPVEVPDVEVDAFKAMLAFIYADDLSGLNGDNAISVLYAADKYNLPKLVKACLNFPIPELRNVFFAFDWARFLGKEDVHCRGGNIPQPRDPKKCHRLHPSDELRLSRDRIAELESAGSDLVAQNENDAADTLKEIQDKIGRIENSVAWLQQGQLRCDRYKFWFATDPEEEQFKEIQDKIGKIENSIARLQEGQLKCVSVESLSLLQEKIDELERNQKADQEEHCAKIDEGMDQLLKVELSTKMEQYQMQQQQKMEQYQKEQQQKMQQYQKEQQQTIDELQKTVALLNGTIGKEMFFANFIFVFIKLLFFAKIGQVSSCKTAIDYKGCT